MLNRIVIGLMVIAMAVSTESPAAKNKENMNEPTTVKSLSLNMTQRQELDSKGWKDRVGNQKAVWVSIRAQRFYLVQNDQILWETRCSTAAKGPGSKKNSFMTPLGWHHVKEKVGKGEPWGRVYRDKNITKGVWHPGEKVREDMVLTRILTLDGEEPGKNKGGDVDSYERCIYIHGTNDEANIGKPTSHGCIRLTNDDVIQAFDMIPEGTLVLITE